jgi:hypothetical protein
MPRPLERARSAAFGTWKLRYATVNDIRAPGSMLLKKTAGGGAPSPSLSGAHKPSSYLLQLAAKYDQQAEAVQARQMATGEPKQAQCP